MKITINFAALFAWVATIGYPLLKMFSSYYITKREFQYPIWDRDGVQIQRRLHHLIQAYIRNFVVNPEWAGLKLLAFIPVWLMTGKKFWNYFSPWRIKKAPPLCKTCQDKGEYQTESFIAGQAAVWTKCGQCSQPSPGTSRWNCACCLDTHFIGPNRPCPHCDRDRNRDLRTKTCSICGNNFVVSQNWATTERCGACRNEQWKERYIMFVRNAAVRSQKGVD